MKSFKILQRMTIWFLIFSICFMNIDSVVLAETNAANEVTNEAVSESAEESTNSAEESESNDSTGESAEAEKETKWSGIGVQTEETDYVTAADWPKAPKLEAGGAVLIEAETGRVLYSKKADTCFYPASITKIMTGLLAIENCKLTDKVTFEGEATTALPEGYVTVGAVPGEVMKLKDWMYGLLMLSANDAANAIGVHISGSISDFADLMNKRAAELGAKNTHFSNPSGLHQTTHYTTPYDMAMIMRECIKHEEFLDIAGDTIYTIKKNNKRKEEYTFVTRHQMLNKRSSNYYKYCKAGKTGYTTPARNTLVTYAEKNGVKLVCVVMDCGGNVTYTDTKALFEYGFDNFKTYNASDDSRYTLKSEGIFSGYEEENQKNVVSVDIVDDSVIIAPKGVALKDLDTTLKYLDADEDADTGANKCFAEVMYTYEGMEVGTAKLKLTTTDQTENVSEDTGDNDEVKDINETSDIFSTNNFYVNIWIFFVVVCVIVLIVAIIAVYMIIRKSKKQEANQDADGEAETDTAQDDEQNKIG